jgi:hypothetical protein
MALGTRRLQKGFPTLASADTHCKADRRNRRRAFRGISGTESAAGDQSPGISVATT